MECARGEAEIAAGQALGARGWLSVIRWSGILVRTYAGGRTCGYTDGASRDERSPSRSYLDRDSAPPRAGDLHQCTDAGKMLKKCNIVPQFAVSGWATRPDPSLRMSNAHQEIGTTRRGFPTVWKPHCTRSTKSAMTKFRCVHYLFCSHFGSRIDQEEQAAGGRNQYQV
jgi:hypothetical protein